MSGVTMRPNIKRLNEDAVTRAGRVYSYRGWEVTIWRAGTQYYSYFKDSAYGGDEARSMRAAIVWRDTIARQFRRNPAGGGYLARDPERTPAEVRRAADAAVDALAARGGLYAIDGGIH